ncbi:MAG: hypothetical protein JXA66_00610 [Oligoflexia bacterium]|nr:hypothetical protein [Oligoflexia bacterium]
MKYKVIMLAVFIIILNIFNFAPAQIDGEIMKTADIEALGFIDYKKDDGLCYLYETAEKKNGYPLVFKSKKKREEAQKLQGKLVKVEGKLIVREKTIAEKKTFRSTIIDVTDIKTYDLFSAFKLSDDDFNKLKPYRKPGKNGDSKKLPEQKGVSLPGNTASTLIFIGGAALIGKIIHDEVTKKK